MLKRIPVRAALTGLALAGALCGCASATQQSAAQHSASAGPAAASSAGPAAGSSSATVSAAIRLGRGFQPRTLRISPGQYFTVTVDPSVRASGPGLPSSCSGTSAPIDGGMLTVRCTSGGAFYYTAQRPGTAELTATVRPRCAPGSMCPQWVTETTLKITIS